MENLPTPTNFSPLSVPVADIAAVFAKKNVPQNHKDWMDLYNDLETLFMTHYQPSEDYRIVVDQTRMLQGGLVLLNSRYEMKMIHSVYQIDFTAFYPSVMIRLWKEGKLQFENEMVGYIFYSVFANRGTIKDIDPEAYKTCKTWINFMYGLIGSCRVNINTDCSIIGETAREIVSGFYDKFKRHTIYCDVDTIYAFPDNLDTVNEMVSYLHKTGYDFEMLTVDTVLFMAKKRYLKIHNGIIKKYGIQELNGN